MVVERILCYLMKGYADVNWISSVDNRRFTIGYCISLIGNLVVRRSKRQSLYVRQSSGAYYRVVPMGVM